MNLVVFRKKKSKESSFLRLLCMAVYLQGLGMDNTAVHSSGMDTGVHGGNIGKV